AMTQRLLADCVVTLEEPFRRTLLLRYFESLSAERIAEVEGVAQATVRWRLAEALERLRAAMGQRTGERKRWMGALVFSSPLLRGAVVMKTKTKVAIAVALLLASGGGAAVVVHQ